jgi:predicted metal-binding membrane protein
MMSVIDVTTRPGVPRGADSERSFLAVLGLLFAASAVVTILWGTAMSAMPEMPMPGGWTMSMAWMRMPEQTWAAAAATFIGMWIVMMIAMMLPSLAPMLRRYRQSLRAAGESCLGSRTLCVGIAYFAVWAAMGVATFALGIAFAEVEMRVPALARAVPLAAGAVVFAAGLLQLTAWKAQQLSCCRMAPSLGLRATLRGAWTHGIRLGIHCSSCCAGLTAILLVIGVMDLRAMAMVTAAITLERLVPAGERVAQGSGAVIVMAGLLLIARAIGGYS